IMCEEGYAWPGTMVVASDSHSNMYGGLGVLGTPIVRTDAASIWATGKTWWQIPPTVKVELKGKLNTGVKGKDVIIALCGFFNNDEVLNHAIEFCGDGVDYLSVDQRLTIANMTTEWGALVGLFPIDFRTITWLENRISDLERKDERGTNPRLTHDKLATLKTQMFDLVPDKDAFYSKELSIDLSSIEPHVSGPNSVKVMSPISALRDQKLKVNKAYLVSCVNSRFEDIKEAADILKYKKISKNVKFYIAAASSEVQKRAENEGDWQVLLDAGAIALPPGCGPCIGLGTGLLEDGEIGISATNRNFKGRMGSKNALAYLASPEVVAYSALQGFIDAPISEIIPSKISATIRENRRISESTEDAELIEGFPREIKGNLIFCPQDNLNTDGIFPGKYTYQDDLTPEFQASVVMENYDAKFNEIAKSGDILVGGYNFGTGSSREQAATALKYKGIQVVLSGSFSATYVRNAINNGFLTIQIPKLVDFLKTKLDSDKLTINTGYEAVMNFTKSVLNIDGNDFYFQPIGKAAQEIIVAGGLEDWVRNNLK
ncbi:MAG: homoaconitase, partial [Melioribacteraceae bacterium]|nr:homoaconitase [Melioribacteraceae bacterium]